MTNHLKFELSLHRQDELSSDTQSHNKLTKTQANILPQVVFKILN